MAILLNKFLTKDPQRVYKWRCVFPSDVAVDPLLIESIAVPVGGNEAKNVHYFGTERKVPEFRTIEPVTLELLETADGQVTEAILNWKNQVQNRQSDVFGLPSQYKKDVLIQMTSGFNVTHTEIKLIGCWPTSTNPYALTYAESDKLMISQTFAVDEVEVDRLGLLESILDLNFVLPNLLGINSNLISNLI